MHEGASVNKDGNHSAIYCESLMYPESVNGPFEMPIVSLSLQTRLKFSHLFPHMTFLFNCLN